MIKQLLRFKYYLIAAGILWLFLDGIGSLEYVPEPEPQKVTLPEYIQRGDGCLILVPPGVEILHPGIICDEIEP